MTPEEAMAFSQGEFRGKVLTKLDSIQSELSEHKKYHNGHQKPWERARSSVVPLGGGAGLMAVVWAVLERV